MKNVLVTGGKGQLATCIKEIASKIKDVHFIFVDIDELNIAELYKVKSFFKEKNITHCINCAAYTAVDAAETNQGLAESVNESGVRCLAEACQEQNVLLIHISTDFVFDGNQTKPYTEEDEENPLGVYGQTKLNGERALSEILEAHFIIRTSWLYSEHGHNFLKTMLKLGQERDELRVISDQIGTPTYAGDLARLIISIIMENNRNYGTYHYSNEGVASWYDFAVSIFELSNLNIEVTPIKTEEHPTPAKRPNFSVMDKSKIKNKLGVKIPYWRKSLTQCINRIEIES